MQFEKATGPGVMGADAIAAELHQRIVEGLYPPAKYLPTERALAEEFAVDRCVIRKSLTLLETRGALIREHGHRPRVRWERVIAPTDRASAQSHTITALLPQNPIYPASAAILQGANLALRLKESPMKIVAVDNGGPVWEAQVLEAVIEEKPAGLLIWHTGSLDTLPHLRRIEELGIPIVFVDHYPEALECNFVGVDNYGAAVEAVDHLLGLGHRRIAHLTSTKQWTTVLERRDGYREALRAAGVVQNPEWLVTLPETFTLPEASSLDLRPIVHQLMSRAEPPTAVFAVNDPIAHYFVTELEAAGFRVPDDVSVIGFDDLERYSPRPALLTTLHQPFDKIGKRAAELLLQRMEEYSRGVKSWRHVIMSAPLISRSTCRPPAE